MQYRLSTSDQGITETKTFTVCPFTMVETDVAPLCFASSLPYSFTVTISVFLLSQLTV